MSFESADEGLVAPPAADEDQDWSGVAAAVESVPDAPPPPPRREVPDAEGVALEAAEPLLDQTGAPAPLPGEGEEPAWAPVPGGEYDATAWDRSAADAGARRAPAGDPRHGGRPLARAARWVVRGAGRRTAIPAATEFGSYDDTAPVPAIDAPPEDLESLLPFDPAAEAAVGPEALRVIDAPRTEFDVPADIRGLGAGEPGDLLENDGFHAAASLATDEAAAWQPEPGALDQGFQLESGGSFDASADAAAPEWATGGAAPMPWDAAPAEEGGPAAPELTPAEVAPDAPARELTPAEAQMAAGIPWEPEEPQRSPAATPAPVDLQPSPGAEAPDAGAQPDAALGEEEIPTVDVEEMIEEVPADALQLVDDAPAEEPAPAPAAPVVVPASRAAPAIAPARTAAPAQAEVPPAVEVLDAPEPEVVAPPAEDDHRIRGIHRVVVHTLEGQVKRGFVENADLEAPELPLAAAAGGPTEAVPTDRVKAVFFMLAPGEQPTSPQGNRVRVTFRDGRQVAGFSPDYKEGTSGFFMIPADARTSTARIWVYRSAVKQVSVS